MNTASDDSDDIKLIARSLLEAIAGARAIGLHNLVGLLNIGLLQLATDWKRILPDHLTKDDVSALVQSCHEYGAEPVETTSATH